MDRKKHWENIYNTKAFKEVSWYQKTPKVSIELLKQLNISKEANIIDIGGGDSYFVDYLLAEGYQNIYVLDISSKAIEKAKIRLGDIAEKVNWIVSDITEFKPKIQFDFWHDRAAFHFLRDSNDIQKYIDTTTYTLAKNGKLAIGTFSENGPKKCSGIEISQYTESKLKNVFKTNFKSIDCFYTDHKTPFDTIQNFVFCIFDKI